MQEGTSFVKLIWATRGLEWHRLHSVLPIPTLQRGVYLIWDPNDNGVVVRLGKGNIADSLKTHLNDPEIRRRRVLLVTWAEAPLTDLDGIERFLADVYRPAQRAVFPSAMPIPVNLPHEERRQP